MATRTKKFREGDHSKHNCLDVYTPVEVKTNFSSVLHRVGVKLVNTQDPKVEAWVCLIDDCFHAIKLIKLSGSSSNNGTDHCNKGMESFRVKQQPTIVSSAGSPS